MIKRVWVFVPNPPYTTAGNDHPSPFSQGAVLPNHILSVRCVSEQFWLPRVQQHLPQPGHCSIYVWPSAGHLPARLTSPCVAARMHSSLGSAHSTFSLRLWAYPCSGCKHTKWVALGLAKGCCHEAVFPR